MSGNQMVSRMLRATVALACLAAVGCGPRVFIDSPANGIFTTDPSVPVTGHITNGDPAGITLKVNGSAVSLNGDGTFATTVPLSAAAITNPIVADIVQTSTGRVDADRVTVISGESVAKGDMSPKAVALRITSAGLDSLEPVVSSLVDFDLATLMPVGTKVLDNVCVVDGGFLGCLGRATVSIQPPPPTISGFDVDFTPATGKVNAVITLHNLDLRLFIQGTSGIVPNCGLRLTSSAVTLTGAFALSPLASQPSKVDVTQVGNISANFVNFSQNFTSGVCDWPIIGDIIQLVVGNVEPMVRGGIEDFLNATDSNGNTVIAAAIESALAGIDIAGPVGQSLGSKLNAAFSTITTDPGGVTLGSDASFVPDIGTGGGQCNPPPGAPTLAASYSVTEPFPTFTSTAPNGLPYGIGLCISTSGFNQLLRTQVECGLLTTSISELPLGSGPPIPLTVGVLAAFIPQFHPIDPSLPARIELHPTLAPFVTGQPGPGGELATMKIAGLILDIVATGPDGDLTLATATLDTTVGINLGFDPIAGALNFQLSPPPSSATKIKVIETPVGADLSSAQPVFEALIPQFLPSLAGGLGSFPVPSFLGMQLQVVDVDRAGNYLSIYANLNPN